MFVAFVLAFFGLLAVDWPIAIVWLAPLLAGVEVIRRRHNDGLAST